MDISTKEQTWKQFKIKEIGEESFESMVFLASNILYLDRLLILEGVFLEKFENAELEPQVPADQRLKIVQIGQMDALSKIMLMIESMFIALGAFEEDKKKFALKLQEYRTEDVWAVVNSILDDKFPITTYWRIMGFPDIKKLDLMPDEAGLFEKMLNSILQEYATTLKWLATFYEQHIRLYDKFKHGLTIKFGYTKQIAEIEGPQELLMAIDNKMMRRRRTVQTIRKSATASLPRAIFSKSDKAVWEKYSRAMSYTRRVTLFLIKNNIVRLQNCAENFIPYDFDDEGKKELMHFPDGFNGEETEALKTIFSKLEKTTYYKEEKIPNYGLDNATLLLKVLQRLKAEDIVEVE